MDLQKIGFKIFAEQGSTVKLVEFIPVFHRWIQEKALDNLLIDVADYSHVRAGPGIVLVAHDGNYAVDESENRRGLVYYSKHAREGNFADRLMTVCRHALTACKLLQGEQQFTGRLNFPGGEFQFFFNDRLCAPNSDETHSALQPDLDGFFKKFFSGAGYTLERTTAVKERYQVTVTASEPVPIDTLLERTSN